ncbi:type VII secretion-associated serine protease mycosin [Actinokineospora sp.]|uniref:type VII secretion-associated serine protease mycosin n=1 Tax=Actinokineospora sp. TaxID=1872133 RepID=UPI0040376209
MTRPTALLAAAAIACAVLVVDGQAAAAAPPAGACRNPDPARPVIAEQPWAQRLLDPRRVWPHSTGAGVVVAVVDSGVDVDHPQLGPGKVFPGEDFFLVGTLPGNFDCVSHGTAAASIIGADPVAGVGFHGVAPGAKILPIRITDRDTNDSGDPTPIDPNALAQGIRFAADQGAEVINLSLSGYDDHPGTRDAIAYAQNKDALIVASVGNRQERGGGPSFPASYPGVLGVGGIDIAGARANGSQIGDYVDLVAPGKGVVGATRAGGHDYWEGTSFAAPFVAGTAALVRAAWPELSAAEVAHRLLATASPARGGEGSQEYGVGVVDPYRAVTEGLSSRPPEAMPVVQTPRPDVEGLREASWWGRAGTGAKLGAGAVAVAILAALTLAWVLPRGRRRRWAATRTAPLPAAAPRDEPPEQIFLFPPPPVERDRSPIG